MTQTLWELPGPSSWGGDTRLRLNSTGMLTKSPKTSCACFAVLLCLLAASWSMAQTSDCRNREAFISKLHLSAASEVKNFALDSVQETKAGFEVRVDWGSGIDHYDIQFNFRCTAGSFYLYRVKKVTFSTKNRDSGTFLDKRRSKVTRIRPNLPIEKFVITDYL